MTDFDPGMPERPLHRPEVGRTGKKVNKPAEQTGYAGNYSPVDTKGTPGNGRADMQLPLTGAPGGNYSAQYAAGPYHVQSAPAPVYTNTAKPETEYAPQRMIYGENDVPTVDQTRQAITGGRNADPYYASVNGGKKAAFSDRQRGILMLAALLAAIAVICLIVSVVRVASANSAMRAVNDKRQQEANAYAGIVNNHLNRRAESGYEPLIRKYAAMYGLNPDLISAVIKRESDYLPRATSSAGARGLMQIMPVNVEWFSHKAGRDGITADDLYDPEINIHLGCWYLYYLGEMFDYDPVLMVCSYHAGQGNVQNWLKNYSSDGKTLTIDEIPMSDTRTYAQRVVNSYAIYAQH